MLLVSEGGINGSQPNAKSGNHAGPLLNARNQSESKRIHNKRNVH